MKPIKISPTIYARLALLTILMSTSVINTYADENHSKKFKISVNGGFDYSVSKLSASSSLIVDDSGEVMSDLVCDDEDLKTLNNANTYKLEQQYVDLRMDYEFVKGTSIWLGVGVTSTSMRNSYKDEDELHTKSAAENPTLLLKGGLSYRYEFKDGWFVSLSPFVAWNKCDNNLLSFNQNGQSAIYYAYEMTRDVFRWEVPVIAGHTLGRWTPYVGISYADYRIADKFKSTVSYVGQDYPITIRDTFHSRSKINGIAGCHFAIHDNLGVKLNLSFSRNINGLLSFYFTI